MTVFVIVNLIMLLAWLFYLSKMLFAEETSNYMRMLAAFGMVCDVGFIIVLLKVVLGG